MDLAARFRPCVSFETDSPQIVQIGRHGDTEMRRVLACVVRDDFMRIRNDRGEVLFALTKRRPLNRLKLG